jgi:type I restriction enzyme S subunit
MRMWQGRSALSNLEGIVSPAYTILKPRKNADALFFSYLFKTPKMVNLFWRNSQGLVGDTLNCKYKDFSIVKTLLPLKDEQTAIAKILQASDKELDLLKAKTDKLKEQKKGMMQVLLTGKKRLNLSEQDF